MKVLRIIAVLLLLAKLAVGQQHVTTVNLDKYAGKWYVIASIPSSFDKDWTHVTESYALNTDHQIDIYTTYRKAGSDKEEYMTAKGFPEYDKSNVSWKVQIQWPLRADYLIEELADDYSYVVVGHPKRKYLYIMNRTGKMDEALYKKLVNLAKEKGYDVSELKKMQQ